MIDGSRPLSRDDFSHAYSIMNDVLTTIHAQVLFAETKNGALLAVNLATVVGIGAILASEMVSQDSIRAWLFVTSLGFSGAGLIALWSFLPVMGLERHGYAKGGREPSNLLFWGDITDVLPEVYLASMFAALGLAGAPSQIHRDLANQIVINAGIARRKFTIFKPAAVVTALSVVLPAGILCLSWLGSGMQFK